MIPTVETAREVMRVAIEIKTNLYFSGFTPRVRASSSPMERMFSFQPRSQRTKNEAMTIGDTKRPRNIQE